MPGLVTNQQPETTRSARPAQRATPRFPSPPDPDRWTRPDHNGYRQTGMILLGTLAALAAPLAGAAWWISSDVAEKQAIKLAAAEQRTAHTRLVASPPQAQLPTDALLHGRQLFMSACVACHGAAGTGVDGLGKDLVKSWFVASKDDAALHQFLVSGRPANAPDNTTKTAMPPKGGRADFTDADLADIVTYVRGLQDPRRMPELPAYVAEAPAAPTGEDIAKAMAAAGGDAELAEYIASGTKLFASTCVACHGADAKGIKGNGKDLTSSELCRTLDDDGLLEFLKKGRGPSDPANTTGIAMPPKGGNPALNDDDLLDIIAYLRTFQPAKPSGS